MDSVWPQWSFNVVLPSLSIGVVVYQIRSSKSRYNPAFQPKDTKKEEE